MRYVKLGEKERDVSEIVLGTMRIADMSAGEVESLIETGLEHGINAIDTADIYAAGKSEELLGEVFATNPALRDKVWLQTKCGIRPDSDFTWYDWSKDHIVQSVDGSLKRLHTDHLDGLLLHRPDALMEPDDVADAFDELHREGKVASFGVSNCSPMQMELLASAGSFPIFGDQVQLSCAFTPMLDAGFEVNMQWNSAANRDGGILEYCHRKDIAVQTWSSLQYGFFEGTFLGSDRYPELNKVLDRIAEENHVTNTAVALAWILRIPGKMQSVVGTTKKSRLADTAAACDFSLSRKEWYEIYLAAGNRLP